MWSFFCIYCVLVWYVIVDVSLLEEHAVRVLRTGCWGEYFNLGGGGQVTGRLIKMRTEEFHALEIVPHFIGMRISFMNHVACMGELWKACNILVWWSEGKSLPGRTWWGCEDKIKMKLYHLGWRLYRSIVLSDHHSWVTVCLLYTPRRLLRISPILYIGEFASYACRILVQAVSKVQSVNGYFVHCVYW